MRSGILSLVIVPLLVATAQAFTKRPVQSRETLASMAGVGAALRGVTGAARSAPVARYFMTPRELPGMLPWAIRGAAVGAGTPFIHANQAPVVPFLPSAYGQ